MDCFKIITFHRAINYGAILQAYSLLKKVQSITGKRSVKIYDYRCDQIEEMYKLFPFKLGWRKLASNVMHLPSKVAKKRKFRSFIKDNISLSNTIDDDDIFITGSDQVFNYSCTDFDKAYFLDFVKKSEHKNSYAASFGFDEIPAEHMDEYRRLLKDFNHLSVREQQGQKIIKELLNREVSVVLDPTMLLNVDEWKKVEKKVDASGKYIFVYLMNATSSIIKFAEDLSKKTGFGIIYISNSFKNKIHGARMLRSAGPDEWVYLLRNAEYVVTNSFHGTAFSINFNKNFFTELLPPPAKRNSRLENILELCNLKHRLIINGKNDSIDAPINYEEVNLLLDQQKEASIDYLRRIINSNNEQD